MRYADHQHCELSHECRLRTHVCAIMCSMEKAGVGLALPSRRPTSALAGEVANEGDIVTGTYLQYSFRDIASILTSFSQFDVRQVPFHS